MGPYRAGLAAAFEAVPRLASYVQNIDFEGELAGHEPEIASLLRLLPWGCLLDFMGHNERTDMRLDLIPPEATVNITAFFAFFERSFLTDDRAPLFSPALAWPSLDQVKLRLGSRDLVHLKSIPQSYARIQDFDVPEGITSTTDWAPSSASTADGELTTEGRQSPGLEAGACDIPSWCPGFLAPMLYLPPGARELRVSSDSYDRQHTCFVCLAAALCETLRPQLEAVHLWLLLPSQSAGCWKPGDFRSRSALQCLVSSG